MLYLCFPKHLDRQGNWFWSTLCKGSLLCSLPYSPPSHQPLLSLWFAAPEPMNHMIITLVTIYGHHLFGFWQSTWYRKLRTCWSMQPAISFKILFFLVGKPGPRELNNFLQVCKLELELELESPVFGSFPATFSGFPHSLLSILRKVETFRSRGQQESFHVRNVFKRGFHYLYSSSADNCYTQQNV